ncbi:MAG TPA: hypothetical protein VH157_01630, partial [Bryobacteraceae bacterium]|nr:hypothetical protein [Bryobacteraceae bacterium]
FFLVVPASAARIRIHTARHVRLAPAWTKQFFRHAIAGRTFHFLRALRKGGRSGKHQQNEAISQPSHVFA